MFNVAIKKAHGETAVRVIVQEANTLTDEVRKRAFEPFVDGGRVDGSSSDPTSIDSDTVHARLDDGLLKISAVKLEQETRKTVAVSAA